MLALIGFLLTIGILVVIHEFGHYLFARLFKVKVICFSIGFGPKLIKWQGRHNQWCISAILLGGYVQMLDEREAPVAPELKNQAYNNKAPWQKLLIAFAGPLFNILFAFILYYGLGLYGVYTLKPIIDSTNPTPLVSNLSQIPTNSTILSLNNLKVDSWNQAEKIFQQQVALKPQINITLKTNNNTTQNISLNLNKFIANSNLEPSLIALGIYPFTYLTKIGYIEPLSPAAKAGLRQGDQITAINQSPITSWFTLSQIIRHSASEKLQLTILRQQQKLSITVIPDSINDDNGQIIGKVGIIPVLDTKNLVKNSYIKHYTILTSLSYAYDSCTTLISTNLTILTKLVQGKISWHNLGGPVTIAKASDEALRQGIKEFIDLLALISLSLAVMNLLPIPVLDGGHILIYALELIRGKPLSINSQQLLFKIGLIIVLLISGAALYNDFLKLLNL